MFIVRFFCVIVVLGIADIVVDGISFGGMFIVLEGEIFYRGET